MEHMDHKINLHKIFIFLIPLGSVLLLCILPLINLFAITFDLKSYLSILKTKYYLNSFITTSIISAEVTTICLTLGLPYAFFISNKSKINSKLKSYLALLALIPLIVNPLSIIESWRVMLQREGIVNYALINFGITSEPMRFIYSRTGVVIVMVYLLLPLMIFPITLSINSIEPSLIKYAKNTGAKFPHILTKIILPLSTRGITAGSLLVFSSAFGFFVVPTLLGSRTELMISKVIFDQVNMLLNFSIASALSLFLLITLIVPVSIATKIVIEYEKT